MFSVLESGPQSSRTSPSSLLPLYNLRVNQQRSCRFPLMDRPTELRLIVAKSAFHHPNGLEWIWTNYRKGPRVATLTRKGWYIDETNLDTLNALPRACKLLFQSSSA
jgi:hypothetical protein